jgi:hypothetical protein
MTILKLSIAAVVALMVGAWAEGAKADAPANKPSMISFSAMVQ